MSVEDERSFKSNNKCWVCNKLSVPENHDRVTGKYRLEVLLIRIVILIII